MSSIKEAPTEDPRTPENYRDSISTVDAKGERVWIYPKKPVGRFYNARTILSFFLLAFLFGAPFVKIGGQPLLLFDIVHRKFIIFGQPFWPQDFDIFAFACLAGIVFIIFFTVIFGRLFCGWICPQTIFMEMVFRKIEYWLEGDASSQRRLDKEPWTSEKILKKSLKQLIFFAISFLIGNTFLAYIIGAEELGHIVTDSPLKHIGGLSAMFFFSLLFYGVFAFFREQACVLVCPYGRLQSALLDSNTIVVHYDFKRGEPRGKLAGRDKSNRQHGDCINCGLCVAVCPTGIDIRNGTQMECVNCTACIDACDGIMDKVEFPRGLIRYDSYDAISKGERHKITPRMIGYSVVLLLLIGFAGYLIFSRTDVETSLLRTPGQLFQETTPGLITNLYNFKIANKTFRELPIEMRLLEPSGQINVIGQTIAVHPDGMAEGSLFIEIPRDQITKPSMRIKIGVYSDDRLIEELKTKFLGPAK